MGRGNRITPVPFTAFDKAGGAGLVSFILTLVNTARFWSDNQMLIAPGVRDRVVNIALRDDEGGLNLNMPSNTIDELDRRGRAAGLLIAARFDPDALEDPETGTANTQVFPNHRWVRFRTFMGAFEDLSRRFVTSRRGSDAGAQARGEPFGVCPSSSCAKELSRSLMMAWGMLSVVSRLTICHCALHRSEPGLTNVCHRDRYRPALEQTCSRAPSALRL